MQDRTVSGCQILTLRELIMTQERFQQVSPKKTEGFIKGGFTKMLIIWGSSHPSASNDWCVAFCDLVGYLNRGCNSVFKHTIRSKNTAIFFFDQ